jgi:hypothetical protein
MRLGAENRREVAIKTWKLWNFPFSLRIMRLGLNEDVRGIRKTEEQN